MKKMIFILGTVVLLVGITSQQVSSQNLMEKMKKKAEEALLKKTPAGEEQKDDPSTTGTSSQGTGGPSNTKGGGLSAKTIDIQQQIADAQTAFDAKKFTDAKYSIRQAILGIELEIGKNILKELPEKIAGLPIVPEEDNVTSSGIGFVGLVIHRVYGSGDQQFTLTIGNDAVMLSAVNMYLASGAYTSTAEEQNVQQTKFKDYRAIIEYDESSGYKLSVPFGQSSILVTEGVNFNSDNEFMSASNEIDIENIKKHLGEQ
ncbi:MAG: hypothetical protein PHD61_05885 [Bacteroidales bacterium]|nr:hypothetical protein [Lentimicrobiaceae bacterium]MDD5694817.1 hypothetical protein [Bacteroidales bacterium]